MEKKAGFDLTLGHDSELWNNKSGIQDPLEKQTSKRKTIPRNSPNFFTEPREAAESPETKEKPPRPLLTLERLFRVGHTGFLKEVESLSSGSQTTGHLQPNQHTAAIHVTS